MKRVKLGGGRWFDRDKATAYEDDTRWDGHNHISVATGSQWVRATLWRTASGMWILETNGLYEVTYDYPFAESDAFRWLIDNGELDAVPKTFLKEMEV
jgi:hypothetical protein